MHDRADVRSGCDDDVATPVLMARRQFLVLGSAVVAGAAALNLSGEMLRAALIEERSMPLLSVGYLKEGAAAALSRFMPAASLASGDVALAASGVRLQVRQLSFATQPARPASLALNVLYRTGQPDGGKVAFAAWARSIGGTSSLSRFVVPVDLSTPLELTVAQRASRPVNSVSAANDEDFATTEGDGRSLAAFSLGRERGAMKLRRGLYVIALRSSAAQRTPDWHSIRFVTPAEGMAPVLSQPTLTGWEPVGFDYLSVAVESA